MSLTSKTITALRLPLAIMVVFIHSSPLASDYSISWTDLGGVDVYNIIRVFGSHVFTHIAVPIFFLISGYLFFLKMQKVDWQFYKTQWMKRVHTLLIPYIIWNIIRLVWFQLFKLPGVLFRGKPWSDITDYLNENISLDMFWSASTWGGGRITILQQITAAKSGPLYVPLWFLRDLMIVVLLAPVLCWLLRKTKGWILLLLAIFYVLNVQFFAHEVPITALLFFGIGAWFALDKKEFADYSVKWLALTFPLWLILLAVNVYYDGELTDMGMIFYPWMVLFGVFAFIGIMAKYGTTARVFDNKVIAFAANNTFFIYVSHNLGFSLARIALSFLPQPLPSVVDYLAFPFITIGICLACLYLMKRYMPRITKMMIGER